MNKENLVPKRAIVSSIAILIILIMGFESPVFAGKSSTETKNKVESFLESSASDKTYQEERFTVDGPVKLDVSTSGGHITVKEGKADEVHVRLLVKTGYSLWGGSDFDPDDYKIVIAQNGNEITALVERKSSGKKWGKNHPSFSFEITSPAETTSSLRTSGGHITIQGFRGDQQVRTSGGHISLDKIWGDVDARTSGGHIKISYLEGSLDARTSGGHINLVNTTGNLNVRTSGGHINAHDISGSLEARTSGGNIQCTLQELTNDLILKTSGGNVSASIPRLSHYELDLSGSAVNVDNLNNFNGSSQRNRVKGTVGNGGRMIEMSTSGGRVSLTLNPEV